MSAEKQPQKPVKGWIHLLLLWILLISPAFSGLIYGGPAWIWLALSSVLLVLAHFFLPSRWLRWVFSLGIALFLLALADLGLNFKRQQKENLHTLFRKTEVPNLLTYVPDTVAFPSLQDCENQPALLFGDSCVEFLFTTDAFGFRNPNFTPGDTVDHLFLGDSFGVGVCQDKETISAQFDSLQGTFSYNLSVSATGPWEQVQHLKRELPRLHFRPGARLIWLVFPANDLDGYFPQGDLPPQADSWRDEYRLFRFRSPMRFLLGGIWRRLWGISPSPFMQEAVFPNGKTGGFTHVYAERVARTTPEVASHPNWPAMQANFAEGLQIARSVGLQPEIYLLPTKGEVYDWVAWQGQPWTSAEQSSALSTALQAFFADLGVSCMDLKPVLIQDSREEFMQDGNLLFWLSDTHLNQFGNRAVARALGKEQVHPD
ncbi:MAG: hypothetical protein H6581_01545 [Bacteroidia bacterium]|nr:hypothetical protein [Bacteroidia bacterium]